MNSKDASRTAALAIGKKPFSKGTTRMADDLERMNVSKTESAGKHTGLTDKERAFLAKIIERDGVPNGLPILKEPPTKGILALECAGYLRIEKVVIGLSGQLTGEQCVVVTDAGRRVMELLATVQYAYEQAGVQWMQSGKCTPETPMSALMERLAKAITPATGGAQ